LRKYLLNIFLPAAIALHMIVCGILPQEAFGRSVTVEGASIGPQSIEQLDTSTTAFIGTATTGPVLKPTLIKSWNDYKVLFGNFESKYYLSGAVYAYFQNGGQRAYIVRVANAPAPNAPLLKPKIVNQNEYLSAAGKTLPFVDYASGLAALEKIEGISLVAIPGQTDLQTQTALIKHCEKMLYRFAILDSKYPAGDSGGTSVQEQISKLSSAKGHAALYYPWIDIQDPVSGKPVCIPPSGAIAGLYVRNDIERGVQLAPSNIAVNGILSLEKNVTQNEQDQFDLSGINVIRYFSGRGYLVWGSKTLSKDGIWKSISVRRLSMNIEESIYKGTQWTVFEPYNEALWARMTAVVDNFLEQMWINRALQGDKPEKAYFVKCDRSTMTQLDIDNRRLICQIGIAAAKPGDFVILRISHQINR
jgi:uncharacterized protein